MKERKRHRQESVGRGAVDFGGLFSDVERLALRFRPRRGRVQGIMCRQKMHLTVICSRGIVFVATVVSVHVVIAGGSVAVWAIFRPLLLC